MESVAPNLDEWKLTHLKICPPPICCFRDDRGQSAMFWMDWRTFLVWNLPKDLVRLNAYLPIQRPKEWPKELTYRVESIEQVNDVKIGG